MLNTQPALDKVNVFSIDQTFDVKIIYKNALRHAQSGLSSLCILY